jgi:transcriptional regulator with XRE-family HTH domain
MKRVEPVYIKIGALMARLRLGASMRQEDVAKKLKISRASLANMEAGRQRIMLHHIMAIAKVMNVPVKAILRGCLE